MDNLAPQSTDYLDRLGAESRQAFPGLYAPYGIPAQSQFDNVQSRVSSTEPMAAPSAAPASSGMPSFPQEVAKTLQTAAPEDTPDTLKEKLAAARDAFLVRHVAPAIWQVKGMTKDRAEALKEQFGARADQTIQEAVDALTKQQAASAGAAGIPAGAARGGNTLTDKAGDIGVAGLHGLATGVLGIGDLVDYGLRGAPVGRVYSAVKKLSEEGAPTSLKEANDLFSMADSHYLGIGDFLQGAHKAVDTAAETHSSDKLRAQHELIAARAKKIEEDPETTALEQFIAPITSQLHGDTTYAAVMDIPDMLAQLAVPLSAAKKADIALKEGQKALTLTERVAQKLKIPSILGGPAAAHATQEWESSVQDMTREQLEQNPVAKAKLEMLTGEFGLSAKEAEQHVKDSLVAQSLPKVLAINLMANVGTYAALPGGIPKALGGGLTGGLVKRVAGTAASQAVQSATAAGIGKVGQNVAEADVTGQPVPLFKGVPGAAGQAVVPGAVVGAAFGARAPEGAGKPLKKPAKAGPNKPTPSPSPEAAPAPEAQQTPASPEAAPVPPTEPTPGPGVPAKEAEAANTAVATAAKVAVGDKRSPVSKVLPKQETAQAVVDTARVFAAKNTPNWGKMTQEQRLGAIEHIAEVFAKKSPADAKEVVALLAAEREALTKAVPVPQVEQQPTPEGLLEPKPAEPTTPPEAPKPVANPAKDSIEVTRKALHELGYIDAQISAMSLPEMAEAINKGIISADAPEHIRKIADAKKSIIPKPAPAAAEPVGEAPKLPKELSGAQPRWIDKKLDFADDVEKALYIVTGKGKSKSHDAYTNWLKESAGFDDAGIAAEGAKIRERVKKLASGAKGDTLRIGYESTPLKGKVPKPPTEGKGLKGKVPPPPKTQAPTPEKPVAGAQGKALETNPNPEPTNEAKLAERETPEAAVQRIVGDKTHPDDIKALADALALAREGDTKPLEEELKTATTYSAVEKKALREAGRSLTAAERGEATKQEPPKLAKEPLPQTKEAAVTNEHVEAGVRGKDAVGALEWVRDNAPNEGYKAIADAVLTRLKEFLGRKAKITFRVSDNPSEFDPGSQGFVNGKIIGGAHTVDIIMRSKQGGSLGVTFESVLHEYIHSVTSAIHALGLRKDAQFKNLAASKIAREIDSLYRAYAAALNTKRKNDVNSLTPFERETFERRNNAMDNSDEFITQAMSSEGMQDSLSRIKYDNTRSSFGKFVDIVRSMLGLSHDYDTFLDRAMRLGQNILEVNLDEWNKAISGKESYFNVSPMKLAEVDALDLTIKNNKKRLIPEFAVSKLQDFWEKGLNSTIGLEAAEWAVTRAGGKIDPENSPYLAGRRSSTYAAEITAQDTAEIVNPISNWITENAPKFSDSVDEFRINLDKFMQAYHELHENIPDLWAQHVGLREGQELTRAELIDDAHAGKIQPKDFYQKLTALANTYAEQTVEEWATKNNKIKSPARLRKMLNGLKNRGYDETTLAPLNDLLQSARDRMQEHKLASGKISLNDPWVEGRGWKWYFPLSRQRSGTITNDPVFDTTPTQFAKRTVHTREGSAGMADNAMEQLIVRMHQAGQDRADAEFKSRLFSFVNEHKGTVRPDITVIEGTPKQGYVDQNGKGYDVLPSPEYGFVYNQGDTHFVVRLDPSNESAAQLDRGVKGFRNISTPANDIAPARLLSAATNIHARALTTWSVPWVISVAALRDSTYIPATVAMELFKNPLHAGQFARGYAKRWGGNMVSLFDRKTLTSLNENRLKLRDQIAQDPAGFFAKRKAYADAGGSTTFNQGLDMARAQETLFSAARANETALGKGLHLTKEAYDAVNKWTGGVAAILEDAGRVAAWDTLVTDLGYSPEHAASVVKGVMDFGQSGTMGRRINAYINFFKVSATGVDVMRRLFTTETGQFDKQKLANWSLFFAGLGAAAYVTQNMIHGDDEDGKAKMAKLDVDTITQKIAIPDGNGGMINFPMALGLPQIMMAPGTLMAAVALGHKTPDETVHAYYNTLTRNASLISPTMLPQNAGAGPTDFIASWTNAVLPSVIRPAVELHYNESSFGQPIHTPHYDPNKFKSEQGYKATPQEYKDMARALREATGIDEFPEDIKYTMRAFGGQNASFIMRMTADKANREASGLATNEAKTFFNNNINDSEFYYKNEANRVMDELADIKREENAAKRKDEEEGSKKHMTAFLAGKGIRAQLDAQKMLDKAIGVYNADLIKIRADKFSTPQGKRDKRKLAESKLRQAVDAAQKVTDASE